jgi:palmitoyltransferase
VGFLLIIQLRNIILNQSTIENRILHKAYDRNHRRIEPFIYPYDLGFKENIRQIFNWRDCFNLVGDGLIWPVRTDCDQYTLTREQLEQKFEKRQSAIRYKIIKSYNGSFFPLNYGLYTCLCVPCSNETRISIKQGDYILVTRWERYWLYGDYIKSNKHLHGWVPRCCVYELLDEDDLSWGMKDKTTWNKSL